MAPESRIEESSIKDSGFKISNGIPILGFDSRKVISTFLAFSFYNVLHVFPDSILIQETWCLLSSGRTESRQSSFLFAGSEIFINLVVLESRLCVTLT